jgi:hypothetical protein
MRASAVAFIAAVALVPVGASTAGGDRSTKASLRLASFAPLTIRGAGFRSREAVRVDLFGTSSARRRTVASATGSFTVRFDGVAATRCDLVRAIAVGARGSRAGLKYLPSPACMPA